MEEKILKGNKSGLAVLIGASVLYIAAIVGMILGGMAMDAGKSPALFIVSTVWVCIGWFPYLGLKVLRLSENAADFAPLSTSPLWLSLVCAAGFTPTQKGLTK